MAKKTVKKTASKKVQKKAVSTQKNETKKVEKKGFTFPKFFQNVEFNLYIMIYLLSMVVLLMSGVLFYTSELLKVTVEHNSMLKEEVSKYDQYVDHRVLDLTFEEFSTYADNEIKSIINLRDYAVSEGYQEINLEGFVLHAKKIGDCFIHRLKQVEVCEFFEINYDAAQGDNLELIVGLASS